MLGIFPLILALSLGQDLGALEKEKAALLAQLRDFEVKPKPPDKQPALEEPSDNPWPDNPWPAIIGTGAGGILVLYLTSKKKPTTVEEVKNMSNVFHDGKLVTVFRSGPPICTATGKPFKTGAKRTSANTVAKACKQGRLEYFTAPAGSIRALPLILPKLLSMWRNDQNGDCVTAEEAAALAFYSSLLAAILGTGSEVFISDEAVLAFCNQFNVLEGAELLPVIQDMESTGFWDGGKTWKDGVPSSVDFSNETTLQAALANGPLKIAIDASALPSGAGNQSGWTAFGGSPGQFGNTDHCIGIWLCGTAQELADAIQKTYGVTVDISNAPSGKLYIAYTWKTVGIVDHKWIMSTCVESWLRSPTSIELGPLGPGPGPAPGTVAVPDVVGITPDIAKILLMAVGLTATVTGDPTQPIVSESPVAGTMVPSGSSVTLVCGTSPTPPPNPPPNMLPLPANITLKEDGTWSTDGTVFQPDTVALIRRDLKVSGLTALPPIIVVLLKFICPLAPTLPPPWSIILGILCGLVPRNSKPNETVMVALPDHMRAMVKQASQQPLPFRLKTAEMAVASWLVEVC